MREKGGSVSRAFLVLALLLGTNLAADELGDLRRKLAQEANPANRAKLTVKLGPPNNRHSAC